MNFGKPWVNELKPMSYWYGGGDITGLCLKHVPQLETTLL